MVAERVDRFVARALQFPVIRSSMITEGGNKEFIGTGIKGSLEEGWQKKVQASASHIQEL